MPALHPLHAKHVRGPECAAWILTAAVRARPQMSLWMVGRAVTLLCRELEINLPPTPVASFISTTISRLPQLAAVQVGGFRENGIISPVAATKNSILH